jgi:hypothetical protein
MRCLSGPPLCSGLITDLVRAIQPSSGRGTVLHDIRNGFANDISWRNASLSLRQQCLNWFDSDGNSDNHYFSITRREERRVTNGGVSCSGVPIVLVPFQESLLSVVVEKLQFLLRLGISHNLTSVKIDESQIVGTDGIYDTNPKMLSYDEINSTPTLWHYLMTRIAAQRNDELVILSAFRMLHQNNVSWYGRAMPAQGGPLSIIETAISKRPRISDALICQLIVDGADIHEIDDPFNPLEGPLSLPSQSTDEEWRQSLCIGGTIDCMDHSGW